MHKKYVKIRIIVIVIIVSLFRIKHHSLLCVKKLLRNHAVISVTVVCHVAAEK